MIAETAWLQMLGGQVRYYAGKYRFTSKPPHDEIVTRFLQSGR